MATGYTACIKDGVSFAAFAMRCARAFGALVAMRDDPMDAPIPEALEPSQWSVKALETSRRQLVELADMTPEEAARHALEDYQREYAAREKRIAECADLVAKYEAMLAHVRAWVPPTPEHEELKAFMMEQITSSIKFDDMRDYYESRPPVMLTGTEWLKKTADSLRADIAYHERQWQEEVERTASRNAWIKALRDSLANNRAGG